MCSYNAVNGVPSCASRGFNAHMLRKLWGWEGVMVSDCGAIDDIEHAHNYTNSTGETCRAALADGTTDFNCGSYYDSYLSAALADGFVEPAELDTAAGRVLNLTLRLALLAPDAAESSYTRGHPSDVDSQAHRELALSAAQQGIVLLRNVHAGEGPVLPLRPEAKIAFIGPHADATFALLGAANYVGFNRIVQTRSPWAVAQARGLNTSYVMGCGVTAPNASGLEEAVRVAKDVDVAVMFVGLDDTLEKETLDREQLGLPAHQLELVQRVLVVQPKTVVVVISGGAVALDGVDAPGVMTAFYPGEYGAVAIVDTLMGNVSPSGRLPYTIYAEGFIKERALTDMSLRGGVGLTYKHYTGKYAAFPFGAGLTYSTFLFTVTTQGSDWPPTFAVHVTNAGHSTSAGAAVVLGFVRVVSVSKLSWANEKGHTSTSWPLRALFDYQRTPVLPIGQSSTVSLTIDASDPIAQYMRQPCPDNEVGFEMEKGATSSSAPSVAQACCYTVELEDGALYVGLHNVPEGMLAHGQRK